ncbi:hypothetical protein C7E13_12330 [Stenotrophomonas maltophilia]|nr:hypothetical protein C405_03567 [Stenotrophomonas maltophilia AU12-09]PSD23138.1 hypothetical protein C7E13_12330 [Stenotrophomonas maltophilia]
MWLANHPYATLVLIQSRFQPCMLEGALDIGMRIFCRMDKAHADEVEVFVNALIDEDHDLLVAGGVNGGG